jgi:hypothetical protein
VKSRTLEPLSPTPSFVDWSRHLKCEGLRSRPHSRLPARLTQSSTRRLRSRRLEDADAYFFFRRLVFFTPFFAAIFVFRFFAMLPS